MNSTDQMKYENYEKFFKMKPTRYTVQLVRLVKALGCKISETFLLQFLPNMQCLTQCCLTLDHAGVKCRR